MPNYNSTLQTNNSSLEEIITQLNNMPDAGGEQVTPVISVNNSNGLITATAGTKSSTYQMAFQPAQTITPTTTNQTIAANTYLGGVQTIKGDANLVASNIVSGKSIFGVVGTATTGGPDSTTEDGLVTRTLTTYTNNRITSIGTNAFLKYTNLTSITFPTVITIGSAAFEQCTNLTSVSFPAATTIGNNAFKSCSALTSVYFPKVTMINPGAFQSCSRLTSANFPAATTIFDTAFSGCTSLTNVSFPNVTSIYASAFMNCTSLKSLSLPLVRSIWSRAFSGCTSLSTIYLTASSVCTLVHSNAFSNTGIWSNKGSIFVPASLVEAYKAATNWTYFSNRIFDDGQFSGGSNN